MTVGRFQVMATLQAARAYVLGHPLDEAKSFGLDRAIFYAAAKRGFKRASQGTGPREPRAPAQAEGKSLDLQTVSLGDEEAYWVLMDGQRRFVIGGEVLEPADFDRQIGARFVGTYERAWDEALDLVRGVERETLTSQRRFYEQVYKPRRDELAAQWSAMAKAR